jgi:hypothetical protein
MYLEKAVKPNKLALNVVSELSLILFELKENVSENEYEEI